MFTDDLLSNKPQDDLTKETSTSKMIFENLCLTWDAISQYELLQSQQRQGENRVFQERHKPPPAPRPFIPHRGAPVPRMPSMQHQNLMHQDSHVVHRHIGMEIIGTWRNAEKLDIPRPCMHLRNNHVYHINSITNSNHDPRMMQQQPPRGRGRGRVNNMPAWMTQ